MKPERKPTKKRWIGWCLIVCGVLTLPHLLVVQLAIGAFWINEGAKILWGGLPLPMSMKVVSPETEDKE
jgi:hypothetical protein